ncbi:hypothetical protein EKO27_g7783 [Xylaria grammica]|uniref:Uncharacterized protein n=1 Tax=Xylaria grammica TaxID=363999 RepID=A0A439CYM6_9PEZI|nr:hypothetical protein EKO27_g7783 [Xylaria grammica]
MLAAGGGGGVDGGPGDLGSFDHEALIQQLNPAVHVATPAEVRKEAHARSRNVFASYETLRAILFRHELTIQKRWSKKTRQQRQKVLLDTWPDMPASHRPDFEAFRRTNRAQGLSVSGHLFKSHYTWPHINQEDLLKPKTLPLLLNARGRNPPVSFAAADFESMHLGLVSKNLSPVFLNCYTMALHGARDASEYGKLVAWDDHPDAFDWMVSRKQYLPGEGLVVLEAQEKLLQFLVDCCSQILAEIPAGDLTSSTFPVQPEPRLKTEKESTGFDSLAAMAAEAPYRVPAKLDMKRIESMLGSRLVAAEDHQWALREDPAYFVEQLIEIKEHRQELIKDTLGASHPTLKIIDQKPLWARVCGTIAFEAYLQLESFLELHRQAQILRLLHDKYKDTISPTEDLPKEMMNAILKFRHYLTQTVKGLLSQLRESLVASPPWRSYFVRQPPPDSTTTRIVVMSKPGANMSPIEKQLLPLLRLLWEDGQDLFFIGLPLVVDELGRLLEIEPRAQDLLSARIASIIGDLAIVSQCIAQFNLFLPWARGYDNALVDREEGIKKEFAERTKPWGAVMAALNERNLAQVVKLGTPSDKRFAYPVEKRRTKQNVEALRQAEQNLDEFWAAVDRVVYTRCGQLAGPTQRRVMRRTPEWVEPATTTANSGKEAVLDPELADLYKPLSTIYIGESAGNKTPAVTSTTKSKTKTQGSLQPTDSLPANVPNQEPHEEPEAPVSVHVDGRSFKVFRTLFFNPAVTSSPGEISWTDFLHAMTSTGLFMAEKMYGSVWQFERLEGDQSRIQFHEPHPRGKIRFTTARRYGRRLNRAFGWTGDMFVLKGK